MRTKKNYLKQSDVTALKSCLRGEVFATGVDPLILARLKEMIDQSVVVLDHQLLPQTVALGAQVDIEYCDDHERAICRLVLPHEVSANPENISVLTPLGLALLGREAPQTIHWPLAVGRGALQVKILNVIHSNKSELIPSYA
ncbi:GreA/GreB family elongation factor [Phragmitibacter flavus]|uniref:GreA/GreB family elongation factor n=1 Tax=Phragmitibacter flavus TaxID=2576071 RepID=A0A5R8KBE4_9BACT|nr:GreA/GreB family elongation factor [Phragmitibacter flavus]TLD69577.1 GreA/GreB family elongation factor [Phragmitibacter flavus]